MPITGDNNGLDYLVRDVGQDIMPTANGYGELKLFSKILYDKDFSVREVVESTISILSTRIDSKLQTLSTKASCPFPPIYNSLIEKTKTQKRLSLYDVEGVTITSSPYFLLTDNISLVFRGIEYVQAGKMGSVYCRKT
jgi:hypothetical protein|tara:strand:+ start:3987 stop:4400 length:414 start_codon:yes stop_codon:yes gene_type:complete